jgi:hypothetical protein
MKRIGLFDAVDSDGKTETIEIYQQIKLLAGYQVPGVFILKLRDGTDVNRIEKGAYETPFGRKFTSSDPNAP